ncbi:glycosyl transferase [Neorhizobium sp. NPDC001467]|uniref:glycosyl transferase n=1 Tax=Neorhizobium sp. NPDC001467 TaxID=3390595 RepID=UPI003D0491FD
MSDRPLKRSVVKLMSPFLFGKARAHYQESWPALRLDIPRQEGASGMIEYRRKPIAKLSHSSAILENGLDEIAIVGSGPTILETETRIGDRSGAIYLNGAISLINGNSARSPVIAIEDERFIWRHFAMLRENVPMSCQCLLSVSVIRAICELDPQWLVGKTIVLIDDLRKPYGHKRRSVATISDLEVGSMGTDGTSGFSCQPSYGVFKGGSVVVSAVQFAAAKRPHRIGFLGIDIVNANRPRFYEKGGNVATSGVFRAESRILSHIALAKNFCDENGIMMVNYSPVSALSKCGIPFSPARAKLPQDDGRKVLTS